MGIISFEKKKKKLNLIVEKKDSEINWEKKNQMPKKVNNV